MHSDLISSLTYIYRNSQEYNDTAIERKSIDQRNSSMRGWGVWRKGHIGVYDRNDDYFAMDGSNRNVYHGNFREHNFTHIIKLCDVDYL